MKFCGIFQSLGQIIKAMSEQTVPALADHRPGPPMLTGSLRDAICPRAHEGRVHWCEQPRHQTFVDFLVTKDRSQAAKMANQPQYYMGP